MDVEGRPPTTSLVPDVLAALATKRMIVIDGQVDDDVILEGRRTTLPDAVAEAWAPVAEALHVVWEPATGLVVRDAEERLRLEAVLAGGGHDATASGDHALLDRSNPLDVADLLRRIFEQDRERVLVVVKQAELTCAGGVDPTSQRQAAALAAAAEAFDAAVELHAFVLLSREPNRVTEALTQRVGTARLRLAAPTVEERAAAVADGFRLPPFDRRVRGLAGATEGFYLRELERLAAHAEVVDIPIDDPRELARSFRLGHKVDPWLSLNPERIREIEKELRASVFGQDRAVSDVLARIDVARSGLELDPPGGATRKSRLELFLVGPTGVGKNELARSLARSIFGDHSAVMTFDMSSFQQEHSGERLFGAPPGYVGHDRGSPLVDRLRERPFSVIVFDEIEKAHPNNWLRLMGAIDEGRVTDGSGVEASLESAIVIFTSNIGSGELEQHARRALLPTEEVERLSRSLVKAHLSEHSYREERPDGTQGALIEGLGRPEIWGRLEGSVVAFDLLREPALQAIVERFCTTLTDSAWRNRGIELEIATESLTRLVASELESRTTGSLWNGRSVKSIIGSAVVTPLASTLHQRRNGDARRICVWAGEGRVNIDVG